MFQLPSLDWLLLPAPPKVTRKIVALNNEREVETLLKKMNRIIMKRIQHSGYKRSEAMVIEGHNDKKSVTAW